MRKIYKYPIELPYWAVELSSVRKCVLVDQQNGIPVVWYEVDTDVTTEIVHIQAVGTGQPVPLNGEHLGSVIISPYVWHLYEVK